MPKALITDLLARHAKTPDGKRFTIWDQALPGFGLRVSAQTKTWTVMLDRKARRRITVGRYPMLGVQAARIEARRVINGAAVLRTTPGITSLTFSAALEKFIELHLPKNRRTTAIERERILRKHCEPVWKSRLMTDIHRGEVLRVLDPLGDTPIMANNTFAVIRLFFRWSVRRGYLVSSPCEALQAPAKRVSRERVLTPDELKIVLSQALTAGTFGTIVSLLAFTGQRRGEIAALHSEWINREVLTITFPKHITKNGQEHVLPITPYVLQLLPEREGLLFPARGQHARAFNGWSKSMNVFRHCCGFADFTLHDLRRTAATNMAELGTAPHVIEKVLNHVTGSTSQSISVIGRIYNRARYLPQMRDALLLHEHFLRRQFDCPAQLLT